MGSHSHPKAHTIASHNDTTGTGAELEELTDGSETTLHSHAAAGGATVATGTYTGNDTDDRQIATGMKCSLVLVFGTSTSWIRGVIPNRSKEIAGGATVTDCLLHATDGFVVDQNNMNWAPNVFYYWAISE